MCTSIPSLLRLRLLSLRPQLALTEIHLVDDTLLYHRLDGRDHVPTVVRAVRPSATDWDHLNRALDEASFWSWPRRWPRAHDAYVGEFAIAIAWGNRAALSAGPIRVAREVDDVLDEVEWITGTKIAVATARAAAFDRYSPPRRESPQRALQRHSECF